MSNAGADTRFTSSGVKRRLAAGTLTLFLACCLLAPPAGAAQAGRHTPTPKGGAQEQKPTAGQGVEVDIRGVKVTIPDTVVSDHEGRKVRFYSDLIKDKVVVLSFFYTSCIYTCTTQGKVFSELQSLLGERLGKSVFLISVTTDPVKDTPAQLKAWAARYNVRPGWVLVTGEEAEMNKLLVPFTGSTAGGGMHLPSTFIGNDRRGLWTSAAGVFAPKDLLRAVNYVAPDGGAAGNTSRPSRQRVATTPTPRPPPRLPRRFRAHSTYRQTTTPPRIR